MSLKKNFIAAFACCILGATAATAQSLPDSTIKKIDHLFDHWNTQTRPGCVVGIIRNRQLVYAKGFGLANLEYQVPNTPATLYHMASISKQFTAYSIIMLARERKLSLDEDIRHYLPWFPDMGQKITVRNLLNHTSGIRDAYQLLALGGTRINDVITQEQVLKVLSAQRTLNFAPGEKYAYSNSNYILLAEIVKAVSGKTLRQFTDSAIFKPLGMAHTHFRDNYNEIDPGRAYSYDRLDSVHFANSLLNLSVVGSTGLLTNVADMSKWVMNLLEPKVGDQADVDLLTRPGVLNNGERSDYAAGMIIEPYKGLRQYWHNGSDAGFRTNEAIFPDQHLGIIVFGNEGDFDPRARTNEIADLLLAGQFKIPATAARRDSAAAILHDTAPYRKFVGYYVDENGREFNIGIRNHILYYNSFDRGNFLLREADGDFSLLPVPDIRFKLRQTGTDTTVEISSPFLYFLLTKDKKDIKDGQQSDVLLEKYIGTYYSPELDTKYGISLKNHQLYLTNAKYDDRLLTLVTTHHLTCDDWWIGHITMTRDAKGQFSGFEVNAGRGVRHLLFEKVK